MLRSYIKQHFFRHTNTSVWVHVYEYIILLHSVQNRVTIMPGLEAVVYPQLRDLLLDNRGVTLHNFILAYQLFLWSTDGGVWTLTRFCTVKSDEGQSYRTEVISEIKFLNLNKECLSASTKSDVGSHSWEPTVHKIALPF